jgi:hypothetical protein
MQPRAALIGPVLAVALVAGACGSSATTGRARTRTTPDAADVAVIRVDTRGGFTTLDTQLAIVPEVSIFGDGRVVVSGPVTAQYPPHALPNLVAGRLADGAVSRLVARAQRAGLLGPALDFGRPGVSDLATTTVTFTTLPACPAGGDCTYAVSKQSAYALDFGTGPADTRLTAAQRAARARLRAFVDAVRSEATTVATEPYRASEVAIFVHAASGRDTTQGGVVPGRTRWPHGDLATIGKAGIPTAGYRCAVLTGTDAATALAAAADASSITRWQSNGSEYLIAWRPLLPDEHTCPDAP